MSDRLSFEKHEALRQEIRKDYLDLSRPQDKPRAIIVAGQPGAGKGGLAGSAQIDLDEVGGAVLIDPDRLRQWHPRYRAFLREDDKTAAERVHADASQWAKELRQDAIAGRRNIVLDATLNDKDKTRELLGQLRKAGYEIEVRVLAVHQRDSRQGVYARYENAKEQGKAARWVPESAQDEAYKGMPVALGHIERNGWADKVTVMRRDGTVIYRNGRADSATSGLSQIAVMAERARDPTAEEKLQHLRNWDKIHGQTQARGADSGEVAKVSEYRWEAHDRMKADQAVPSSPGRAEPMPQPGAESIRALSAAQKARQEEWRRQSR
ncbi:MAG TPA: zeta toxin family protein [Magnetospirillaceae bacterium]|nr:zeta toxin family protein [Magnetospirillaceae bacterium]